MLIPTRQNECTTHLSWQYGYKSKQIKDMVIKYENMMKWNVPNWSETFLFFLFNEAFVEVVYNHCQCRVPKTHSFIPLLSPCTVHKLMKWCFRKGSEYYLSLAQEKEAHFFVKAGNHLYYYQFCLHLVSFFRTVLTASRTETSGFKGVLKIIVLFVSVWWGKTYSILLLSELFPSETLV